jgi:hypothetical protein
MTYESIDILLATKHKKEEAIRQPFIDAFNANIIVPNDYDTDVFGTFTGEIPRLMNAYDTVIKKANDALFTYSYEYAIASEGSFGPHPTLFLSPADIEIMCFVDRKKNITITETELTTKTNYAHLDITPLTDYASFLKQIQFGSHALVIRLLDNNEIVDKGIKTLDELTITLNKSFKQSKQLRLETDMRAMMNPTRMSVINTLAIKLVNRLKCTCRKCETPGFGKLAFKDHLDCGACGSKTNLHKYQVSQCIQCDYQELHPRADGLSFCDPTYCNDCNP